MPRNRSFGIARVAGPRIDSQRHAWPLAAMAMAGVVVYLPFFKNLVSVSISHPYAGHVTLVPVFAAVLLWLERHRFQGLSAHPHAGGAGLVALALALVAIGYRIASVPLQAVSFVAAAAGIALWFYGARGLRAAGFVLAFLLLMVPPPREAIAALAPGIQKVVAAFSAQVLESLRIPVVHQGVFLQLPALTLEVAEECAGLRFSLILLVFVSAFARAVVPTRTGQFIAMSLAIPVAMLANAARVVATSVGVYAIGPAVATGPLHYYIGKGFWAVALFAMIGVAGLLRAQTTGVVAGRRPGRGPCVAGLP